MTERVSAKSSNVVRTPSPACLPQVGDGVLLLAVCLHLARKDLCLAAQHYGRRNGYFSRGDALRRIKAGKPQIELSPRRPSPPVVANFEQVAGSVAKAWHALNKATTLLPGAAGQEMHPRAQPKAKRSPAAASAAKPESGRPHDVDHSSFPASRCTSSTEVNRVGASIPERPSTEQVEGAGTGKSSLQPIKTIVVTSAEMQAMKTVQSCLDRVRKKIPHVANQWKGGVLPSRGESWVRGLWHSIVYDRKWQPYVQEKHLHFQALSNLDLVLEEQGRRLIKSAQQASSPGSGHDVLDPHEERSSLLERAIEERNYMKRAMEEQDAFTLAQVKEIAKEIHETGSACCEGMAAVTLAELCMEPALADCLLQWEVWTNRKGETHNFVVVYNMKGEPLAVADGWTNTFRAYRYKEISSAFLGSAIISRRDPNNSQHRKAFSESDRSHFESIRKLAYDEVNRLLTQETIKANSHLAHMGGPKSRLFPPPGNELVKTISTRRVIKQYDRYTFLERGTIYRDMASGDMHDPVGDLPPGVAIGGQGARYEADIAGESQAAGH